MAEEFLTYNDTMLLDFMKRGWDKLDQDDKKAFLEFLWKRKVRIQDDVTKFELGKECENA